MKYIILIGLIVLCSCTNQFTCDIGNMSVAGDYTVIPLKEGQLTTILNKRDCARKDCIAYNNYMNGSFCMV